MERSSYEMHHGVHKMADRRVNLETGERIVMKAVKVKFRDGELDVATADAASPATPRRKPRQTRTAPKQDDLFG